MEGAVGNKQHQNYARAVSVDNRNMCQNVVGLTMDSLSFLYPWPVPGAQDCGFALVYVEGNTATQRSPMR